MYLNVEAPHMPTLVNRLTESMNGARLPFALKVLVDPRAYYRCDVAVLFVLARDAGVALPLVERSMAPLASRTPVPPFTKAMGHGFSLAEDPGPLTGKSFGRHRSFLVAEAAVRSWERNVRSVEERIGVVEEVFAENGIDPRLPFLNPGAIGDVY
jgi:hypothetical protein